MMLQLTHTREDAMPDEQTNGFIRMEISKIRIDERRGEQIIVLKECGGARMLPIIIGISEVTAIKMKISGVTPPRPLTHDLLQSTIEQLGAKVEKILINKLEFNTFFAQLVLRTKEGLLEAIDARPSDSIALALRADAPIFVAPDILDQVASSLGG